MTISGIGFAGVTSVIVRKVMYYRRYYGSEYYTMLVILTHQSQCVNFAL